MTAKTERCLNIMTFDPDPEPGDNTDGNEPQEGDYGENNQGGEGDPEPSGREAEWD